MKIDPFNPYGTLTVSDDEIREAVMRRRMSIAKSELSKLTAEAEKAERDFIYAVERRNALARQLRDAGMPNTLIAQELGVPEMAASRIYHEEAPPVPPAGTAHQTPSARRQKRRVLAWREGVVKARGSMIASYVEALQQCREEHAAGTLGGTPFTPEERAEMEQLLAESEARRVEHDKQVLADDQWIERSWAGIVAKHEAKLTPTLPDADAAQAS